MKQNNSWYVNVNFPMYIFHYPQINLLYPQFTNLFPTEFAIRANSKFSGQCCDNYIEIEVNPWHVCTEAEPSYPVHARTIYMQPIKLYKMWHLWIFSRCWLWLGVWRGTTPNWTELPLDGAGLDTYIQFWLITDIQQVLLNPIRCKNERHIETVIALAA